MINEYMMNPANNKGSRWLVKRRVKCKDGFSISVQANENVYCRPQDNEGPWTHFECGYPSDIEPDLLQYADDPSVPMGTIYGYVPIEVVEAVIAAHGGISD